MNASSQQVSRMRMPEVTKTKLWERCFGNLADPILGQAIRLQWFAIGLRHHNISVHRDASIKHAVAVALKGLPFGHLLLDCVPSNFIYQRCYIAT